MDEETAALIQEIVRYMSETEIQLRALRQLLIEKGAVTEEEIAERVELIRRDEYVELRAEQLRRDWAKSWEGGTKQ